MLLITGASGTVGGAVVAEVVKTRKPFKAMFRSAQDAAKANNITTVIADFADKASLRRCLEGIETVFLVCSPVPELVELEGNMIEACRESKVRTILLNSALGAADYPKSFPSWHRKVEDKLKVSGLKYVILRPNTFMQNIVAFNAPSIRAQGAFYSAMGQARTSFIDVRDVARVVAKVAGSDEHLGKTYELNGPEAVNSDEVAAKISRVAGRSVKFVNIPEEAQRKAMQELGMPEWLVTALLDLQKYYTGGQGGEVDGTLQRLLGATPTTLDQFLKEFAGQFSGENKA
jgi:uncharacterized protein YbjT (DUF2867 family)